MYRCCIVALIICLPAAALGGCKGAATKAAPSQKPVVPVSHPEQRMVTDYVDYTGRTNSVKPLVVEARVTGYLAKKPPFKEGADVKMGDVLFEIDPSPYQAQYNAAKAQVAYSEASLRYAVATNARYKELYDKSKGTAVSKRELDQYQAQEDQAIATLELANANLASAKLNLDWTKVQSPINGRISRYYVTEGNMVNQDTTQLTTVVSMDPMYVYFDMDEPTMLRMKRAINQGTVSPVVEGAEPMPLFGASALGCLGSPQGSRPFLAASALVAGSAMAELPVSMGLQGEEGYPHRGYIDFMDNQVNPNTGSIPVRGVFANPKPARGTYLLVPGMFVRIRLPMGRPYKAQLVIDRAVTSDQGLKYVYVLGADNKAQLLRVTTGPLQENGLRVITEGLKPSDWVVVGALQQVQPGKTIEREELDKMPTLGPVLADKEPEKEAPALGQKGKQ